MGKRYIQLKNKYNQGYKNTLFEEIKQKKLKNVLLYAQKCIDWIPHCIIILSHFATFINYKHLTLNQL